MTDPKTQLEQVRRDLAALLALHTVRRLTPEQPRLCNKLTAMERRLMVAIRYAG